MESFLKMPERNNRKTRILEILTKAFSPEICEIVDDSAKHAGHAGASPLGETHYSVHIVSNKFIGLSRVQSQRLVLSALQPEFDKGLHALSLKANAPKKN